MDLPLHQDGADGSQISGPDEPIICAVCRNEPPVNGISLDCRHVFCYLCLKSASETTGCCPLCRKEISRDFDFRDHSLIGVAKIPHSSTGFYWFYEGFRGWWLFDPDTNSSLEDAHSRGIHIIERFIAGHFYKIDLDKMEQQRREGGRTRKICRETLDLPNILGLSGIRGQDFEEILSIMRSMNQTADNPPV